MKLHRKRSVLWILLICGVLFFVCVLWFIPYITTVNKIFVNGDEITRSAIRFSEYPSYVYETDSNVSSSMENSPLEIQNFVNKRNTFLTSYLSENKLQKIENSVDPENFLLDKNNLIQIIPMQYSSQDYFLLVFCNGYCTNYLVVNETEEVCYSYTMPWVSFGNCVVSLHNTNQIYDLCMTRSDNTGLFSLKVLKLQQYGLGGKDIPITGVFNSSVIRKPIDDNIAVSNEIESANYFVFKKNVVKFLNVNNELPLFRQVEKCLLIFDYVTGTYSFITDPL